MHSEDFGSSGLSGGGGLSGPTGLSGLSGAGDPSGGGSAGGLSGAGDPRGAGDPSRAGDASDPTRAADASPARATLDAWRERGADRLDPLRFQFIAALERRAAGYAGDARRLLDDRLRQLLDAYAQDWARASGEQAGAASTANGEAEREAQFKAQCKAERGAARDAGAELELVAASDAGGEAQRAAASEASAEHDDLSPANRDPKNPDPAPTAPPDAALRATLASLNSVLAEHARSHRERDGAAAYPELPALDYFREVWSRVRTDKQLRQSLAQVPGNAGPLNSSSLVHRSLSLMRELSPGYLKQFLSYVDTLSWLEQMHGGAAPSAKDAPRAGSGGKTTRAKAR